MRASSTIYLAAAAALAGLPAQVSAFSNTSPFFLITTSEIPKSSVPSTSTSTLSASQFVQIAKDVISQCKSDEYVIATQPGVHASDFRNGHAGMVRGVDDEGLPGMPHLKRAFDDGGEKGHLVVPFARNAEINGMGVGIDGESTARLLADWAKEKCGAEVVEVDATTGTFERYGDMKPKVMIVKFEALDADDVEERAKALAAADAFLFSLIDSFPSSKYTLVYTSTPRARVPNNPIKSQPLHTTQDELRRRAVSTDDGKKNATIPTGGSLFQRYAFFTPGVWMGYISAFFLLSILYAGLSALTSLKVSYAAFEKEAGPAAKKQQ